ncbi:hypothetical protein [Salinigranum sp. GCM10025319]|uniref:hypothetical protein n=1 Tax=Salinigranum sp. GCM10025319 TaxID=3252687 RepID=UPI00360A6DC1
MVPLLLPNQTVASIPLGPTASTVPLLASTSLAVRWLHVLAATVAVGGSVLTWVHLRVEASDHDDERIDGDGNGDGDGGLALDGGSALSVARGYEWLFWAAVGTLVMTGVGNLGAFAPTLPGGRWRTTLDAKLALLVVVLLGSAVRVLLLRRVRREPSVAATRVLRRVYGVTAVGLVALLTLAEVLAHG